MIPHLLVLKFCQQLWDWIAAVVVEDLLPFASNVFSREAKLLKYLFPRRRFSKRRHSDLVMGVLAPASGAPSFDTDYGAPGTNDALLVCLVLLIEEFPTWHGNYADSYALKKLGGFDA